MSRPSASAIRAMLSIETFRSQGLADTIERVERMAGAVVPLVTDYPARRQTGDT